LTLVVTHKPDSSVNARSNALHKAFADRWGYLIVSLLWFGVKPRLY